MTNAARSACTSRSPDNARSSPTSQERSVEGMSESDCQNRVARPIASSALSVDLFVTQRPQLAQQLAYGHGLDEPGAARGELSCLLARGHLVDRPVPWAAPQPRCTLREQLVITEHVVGRERFAFERRQAGVLGQYPSATKPGGV